jgi:hypothetical protein
LIQLFRPRRLFLSVLGHGIQGAAVLEPVDLAGVEGVRQGNLESGTILGVDAQGQGLANSQLGAQDVNLDSVLVQCLWMGHLNICV